MIRGAGVRQNALLQLAVGRAQRDDFVHDIELLRALAGGDLHAGETGGRPAAQSALCGGRKWSMTRPIADHKTAARRKYRCSPAATVIQLFDKMPVAQPAAADDDVKVWRRARTDSLASRLAGPLKLRSLLLRLRGRV